MTYRQVLGYITASPGLDLDSEMDQTAMNAAHSGDIPYDAHAEHTNPKQPDKAKPVAGK